MFNDFYDDEVLLIKYYTVSTRESFARTELDKINSTGRELFIDTCSEAETRTTG